MKIIFQTSGELDKLKRFVRSGYDKETESLRIKPRVSSDYWHSGQVAVQSISCTKRSQSEWMQYDRRVPPTSEMFAWLPTKVVSPMFALFFVQHVNSSRSHLIVHHLQLSETQSVSTGLRTKDTITHCAQRREASARKCK